MHEALFDDRFLKGTGVETLDFAKAMIDEGYHPMTMYFPLVVHGAMLIEPTESESKDELDRFIGSMRSLAERAKRGRRIALNWRQYMHRCADSMKPELPAILFCDGAAGKFSPSRSVELKKRLVFPIGRQAAPTKAVAPSRR